MDVRRTVLISEPLARLRTQGLAVFPSPLCSIGPPTQPYVGFRDHAGLFDLCERLPVLLLRWHRMPTQQMHDPLTSEQIPAHTCRVTPLTAPPWPACAFAPLEAPGRCRVASVRRPHPYPAPRRDDENSRPLPPPHAVRSPPVTGPRPRP